jgi:Rieske Fe-S protein
MNRKEFVWRCASCLGLTALSTLLPACAATKYIDAAIDGPDLLVPANSFEEMDKSGNKKLLPYVVAQNGKLEYPVAVFRFSDTDYSALLMRCTHQGTELQIFGDRLQCPAHGSEFSNRGVLRNGPADANLRIFPVKVEGTVVRVNLS